jgi:hypothetical protein
MVLPFPHVVIEGSVWMDEERVTADIPMGKKGEVG